MKNNAVAVPSRKWLPALALSGLLGLLVFQAWAYACRLPLSLGPRVILQPWLLQHGSILYENIADQHSPLMSFALAALRPLVPDGLRLAILVQAGLLSVSTLLIFMVGRRRIGWAGGLWAAFFFVAWSPMFAFGKFWHESFLTPLYLVFALRVEPSGTPRSLRSRILMGLFGGFAILVKQYAAVLVLAAIVWDGFDLHRAGRPWARLLRETGLVGLAVSLPIAAYAAFQYMWAGTLRGFFYWTVGYNATGPYASLAAKGPAWHQVMLPSLSFLLVPAAVFCVRHARRRRDPVSRILSWWIVLLAASSVMAYPRFSRFHFQPALPVLALISSLTIAYIRRLRTTPRALALGLVLTTSFSCGALAIYAYRPVVRAEDPLRVSEYSPLVPLADGIREHLGPDDRIYIFPDDEPIGNLYYLLHRPIPKFWIFHYPWFITDRTRSRILATLEEEPPDWIVYSPNRWDIETRAPEIMDYIRRHYRRETGFRAAERDVWLLKRRVEP